MTRTESDHELLRKELQFRKALVALTNELLSSTLDSGFYQTALERTVELVPDAEGGSVLIRRDDGQFQFEAAVGFDLESLRAVTLSGAELGQRSSWSRAHKIDIQDYDQRLEPGKAAHFEKAGNLHRIRATLSVPLRVREETMGYFNLDNFAHPEAFTEEDIEISEAIAAQVSLALFRLLLEQRLEHERRHFEYIAQHDPLTDLANRRAFFDSLERSLALATRRRSSVGLLFIDLDNFKEVNDRYGHEPGDCVLVEIAARLRKAIRKGDMPARIGGDEFAVILMDIRSAEDAERIATKICRTLSTPVYHQQYSLELSASIGTAVYPDQAVSADELLRTADNRMYEIKSEHGVRG